MPMGGGDQLIDSRLNMSTWALRSAREAALTTARRRASGEAAGDA